MSFCNGIGFTNSTRQEIPALMIFLFCFSILKSSRSGSRLKLFVSSFKGWARIKNICRFEQGLGTAWLEVQDLSWAPTRLGMNI